MKNLFYKTLNNYDKKLARLHNNNFVNKMYIFERIYNNTV